MQTERSDTQRRQMPGLATKGSVFAWNSAQPVLLSRAAGAGLISDEVVNLRKNTASGGTSVDVPVWAAGAVVAVTMIANVYGTSTYFQWMIQSSLSSNDIMTYETPRSLTGAGTCLQVIIPFYDEPLFYVTFNTNGTGTATYSVVLLGFVRNV